jgi:aerobic-type carbon monoxide dehydrogenase small subunit (CoxS/CutS family)
MKPSCVSQVRPRDGCILAGGQSLDVIEKRPDLDEEELVDALFSNLCRCTDYANISSAVRAGAANMKARA